MLELFVLYVFRFVRLRVFFYAAIMTSYRDRDQRLRGLSVCLVVLDNQWRRTRQQCEALSAVPSLSICRDQDQRLRAVDCCFGVH